MKPTGRDRSGWHKQGLLAGRGRRSFSPAFSELWALSSALAFQNWMRRLFFFYNSKSSKLWELVASLRLPQPSNLIIMRGRAMAQHPPSYRTPVQHNLTLIIKQWHRYAMLRNPRFKNIKPLRKVFLLSPCFCSYYELTAPY